MGEERDTTKPTDNRVAGQRVMRLGQVTRPEISFFPAEQAGKAPAVLVLPGGGYHILASDLEGTEVCDWLNSIGLHAVLLKYRVPKRAGQERYAAALQDAQRAMRLVRHHAGEFNIDPAHLGVIGFSAGGHLAATLASSMDRLSYPSTDEADRLRGQPDFSMLIYPAYLTLKDEGDRIAPEVAVTTNHPPTFLVIAQDDPVRVENPIFYYLALKRANVPSELHVYPTGGHGYGLRRTEHFVTTWPDRATDWLRSRGIVKGKYPPFRK